MAHLRGKLDLGLFALLLSSALMVGCGGGSEGGEDTTAEGTPLSADVESQPDSSIQVADNSEDTVEEVTPEEIEIRITGDGCESTADLEALFLQLVNEARSQARFCGLTEHVAVPAVTWNERLEGAALTHSIDMGDNNFFSHTGSDASGVGQRVTIEQYDWRRVAENIAAGQHTIEQAMDAWLVSPPHCANIMDGRHHHVGVSCHENFGSTYNRYWTMVLAQPQS